MYNKNENDLLKRVSIIDWGSLVFSKLILNNYNQCTTEFMAPELDNDNTYEIDFINDTQNTELKKGIIMYFSNKISNKPVYIHKPYEMSLETFELWGEKKIDEYLHLLWIKNIYWKLDEFSCVLVIRNRIWFQDNVYMLQEVSDIIKKERITGYEHRAPKKRVLKNDEFSGLPSKINISSFYKKNEI